MIQKDGKTYLDMQECIEVSNQNIKSNAAKFAKKVVQKQESDKNLVHA